MRRTASKASHIPAYIVGLFIGMLLGYAIYGSLDMVFSKGRGGHGTLVYIFADIQQNLHGGRKLIDDKQSEVSETTYHTLFTSNGSPYLNIQSRIMVQTFKMAQKMPGGDKMVAITRILHRSADDHLMEEIPTFRAEPLDATCDVWCEFPVGDRPHAVAQFFDAASSDPSMIKAPWILMLEGDYVWMKPLPPLPVASSDEPSVGFLYTYISPENTYAKQIMEKVAPEVKGSFPASGPAPVLMRREEWENVVEDWRIFNTAIETNEIVKKHLGWVREMYAFSMAIAKQGIKMTVEEAPDSILMAQPPHDTQISGSLFHYTWGVLVKHTAEKEDVSKLWYKFDKRAYVDKKYAFKVPEFPLPPPYSEGHFLFEGPAYTESLHNTVVAMVSRMNEASRQLPDMTDRMDEFP